MRTPLRRDAPPDHPDHKAQALAEDITQQFDDWRQARGMTYSELGIAAGSSREYGNHLLQRPRNLAPQDRQGTYPMTQPRPVLGIDPGSKQHVAVHLQRAQPRNLILGCWPAITALSQLPLIPSALVCIEWSMPERGAYKRTDKDGKLIRHGGTVDLLKLIENQTLIACWYEARGYDVLRIPASDARRVSNWYTGCKRWYRGKEISWRYDSFRKAELAQRGISFDVPAKQVPHLIDAYTVGEFGGGLPVPLHGPYLRDESTNGGTK